jgi:hypothetical protein
VRKVGKQVRKSKENAFGKPDATLLRYDCMNSLFVLSVGHYGRVGMLAYNTT